MQRLRRSQLDSNRKQDVIWKKKANCSESKLIKSTSKIYILLHSRNSKDMFILSTTSAKIRHHLPQPRLIRSYTMD